jgi:hypothetical protein
MIFRTQKYDTERGFRGVDVGRWMRPSEPAVKKTTAARDEETDPIRLRHRSV